MSSRPQPKTGTKRSKAATSTGRPLGRKDLRAQKKNEQMVAHALAEVGLMKFGKVVKKLGNGKVEIVNEKGKTGIATIRGVLCRKRGCPIEVDDIVILERIEGTTAGYERRYMIVGNLPRKDAQVLFKEGLLPDHIYYSADALTKQSTSLAEADDAGFYFDYLEEGNEVPSIEDYDKDMRRRAAAGCPIAIAAGFAATGGGAGGARALPPSEYFTEDGEINFDRI